MALLNSEPWSRLEYLNKNCALDLPYSLTDL